jgi:hypothetical protein
MSKTTCFLTNITVMYLPEYSARASLTELGPGSRFSVLLREIAVEA